METEKRQKITLTSYLAEEVDATVGDLTLTEQVTGLAKGNFGTVLKYDMPKGAGAVMVCANYGAGLRPIKLLLPHQVYTKDLEKLAQEPGIREVVLIPVRSEEYITIAKR